MSTLFAPSTSNQRNTQEPNVGQQLVAETQQVGRLVEPLLHTLNRNPANGPGLGS